MTIGNKIFELRSAKNLSQGDLAGLLEVSRQSVSKWETDGAVPELDKLIKMCDIFGVTLDELAGRSTVKKAEAPPTEKSTAFTPQKLAGCILLAASLLGGILAFIFAEHGEEFYVIFPFIVATLVCAVLCLCLREHAGYWCVWVVLAPISLLTPRMVRLPLLSGIVIIQILIYIIMAYVANKIFTPLQQKATKQKSLRLAVMWCISAASYIFVLFFALSSEIAFSWFALCFLNFTVYAAFALLITYTVRYIKSNNEK